MEFRGKIQWVLLNSQVRGLALSKAGRDPDVVLEREQRAVYPGSKPLPSEVN